MTIDSPIYAITGATGNIGSKLADHLIRKGKKVRVIGRRLEKLVVFQSKGAEAVAANLENTDEVIRAFQGATAVFAMIPPKYAAPDFIAYQNQVGEAIAMGVKSTGVSHVVSLSSVGGHLDSGNGPIKGLHLQERRFSQLLHVNIVHLRPCYFMENLLVNLEMIRNMNKMGSPIKGDLPLPMIATRDIAEAAADLLSNLSFSGITTKELLGAADVTMNEAAKEIGHALNKPDLSYIEFPYKDAENAMLQMGFSADGAKLMVEMTKGFNERWIEPTESRSKKNTTPTTIKDFAKIFARIYNNAKSAVLVH